MMAAQESQKQNAQYRESI